MPAEHNRCLSCYRPLDSGDFHSTCSKKFFGTPTPPDLPYGLDEMHKIAEQVIRSSVSVTGVQAKVPLDLESFKQTIKKNRFTVVGMWGRFVLKPPSPDYTSLPELEDLTLHLAEIFGIRTVPHTLIRLRSGELAFMTKRVDRVAGEKLHMEDMCQLTGRLTEDKYKGSLEQIGKAVARFSDNRGFDLLEFFHVNLFSFLTGNADMHLKNFSLLRSTDGLISLCPAYDLVPTKIAIQDDPDESALTVNGKKRNLRRGDFYSLAKSLGLNDIVLKNSARRFTQAIGEAQRFIDFGFVSNSQAVQYHKILQERADRLSLI